MRNLLILMIGVLTPSIVFAAIFSWLDQSGNTVFGDSPPQGVTATPVTPAKLTVLEGFGSRYGSQASASTTDSTDDSASDFYQTISVIAPKQGQAIRANNGDVTAAISIAPALRTGDQIVFRLDGKEIQKSDSKVANMPNLSRGEHTLSVSIVDGSSKPLMSGDNVKFVVLRAAIKENVGG